MEDPSQTCREIPSTKQVFITLETADHPFDITLVVDDGKELKAHRRVLSEACPYFEKLLNNDMKESNEGVIRLKMVSEPVMRDILEFIYTGSVQISTQNAQELITMADYLVLPNMKTVAGNVLSENLNASNSFSTYYFAEKYQCEKLLSKSKNYILSDFIGVVKTDGFLNLSYKEVKKWLSNDGINVDAEEDVFKIILTWINHRKSKREQYFAELFQEVRLVYVSRDFLLSDIVTSSLVNDNEGCMNHVKNALKLIDGDGYHHRSVNPRKTLEIPVIVIGCLRGRPNARQDEILCYHPCTDSWSWFRGSMMNYTYGTRNAVSCHGKLYFISQQGNNMLSYDSFPSYWASLPNEDQRKFVNVFVRNENEIYALLCDYGRSCPGCVSLRSSGIYSPCTKRHLSYIVKYTPELNSWEDISSHDMGLRFGICVVAKNNFVYFLGGTIKHDIGHYETLTDADRYDLSTNTWDTIADLQEPRRDACGAATHGKIVIVGGGKDCSISCEVYHETTNEWHFIARPKMTTYSNCVCADGKLYLVKDFISSEGNPHRQDRVIECYDPSKNEWDEKAPVPSEWNGTVLSLDYNNITFACSMRAFKGSKFLQQALYPEGISVVGKLKHKCAIM